MSQLPDIGGRPCQDPDAGGGACQRPDTGGGGSHVETSEPHPERSAPTAAELLAPHVASLLNMLLSLCAGDAILTTPGAPLLSEGPPTSEIAVTSPSISGAPAQGPPRPSAPAKGLPSRRFPAETLPHPAASAHGPPSTENTAHGPPLPVAAAECSPLPCAPSEPLRHRYATWVASTRRGPLPLFAAYSPARTTLWSLPLQRTLAPTLAAVLTIDGTGALTSPALRYEIRTQTAAATKTGQALLSSFPPIRHAVFNGYAAAAAPARLPPNLDLTLPATAAVISTHQCLRRLSAEGRDAASALSTLTLLLRNPATLPLCAKLQVPRHALPLVAHPMPEVRERALGLFIAIAGLGGGPAALSPGGAASFFGGATGLFGGAASFSGGAASFVGGPASLFGGAASFLVGATELSGGTAGSVGGDAGTISGAASSLGGSASALATERQASILPLERASETEAAAAATLFACFAEGATMHALTRPLHDNAEMLRPRLAAVALMGRLVETEDVPILVVMGRADAWAALALLVPPLYVSGQKKKSDLGARAIFERIIFRGVPTPLACLATRPALVALLRDHGLNIPPPPTIESLAAAAQAAELGLAPPPLSLTHTRTRLPSHPPTQGYLDTALPPPPNLASLAAAAQALEAGAVPPVPAPVPAPTPPVSSRAPVPGLAPLPTPAPAPAPAPASATSARAALFSTRQSAAPQPEEISEGGTLRHAGACVRHLRSRGLTALMSASQALGVKTQQGTACATHSHHSLLAHSVSDLNSAQQGSKFPGVGSSPTEGLPPPLPPPRPKAARPLSGVDLPPSLVCPITQELMEDPVVTDDGQTYELHAITATGADASEASPRHPLFVLLQLGTACATRSLRTLSARAQHEAALARLARGSGEAEGTAVGADDPVRAAAAEECCDAFLQLVHEVSLRDSALSPRLCRP
jgi:hypothetical protein